VLINTNHQNAPLHEGTKGLFNKELISKMKKGAWLVNTARGAICIRQDVADALESGHLNGYAGDVWGMSSSPASRAYIDNQMSSLLPRTTLGER
jgi:formate dehydrogenase